jgi:hypothetical protein
VATPVDAVRRSALLRRPTREADRGSIPYPRLGLGTVGVASASLCKIHIVLE